VSTGTATSRSDPPGGEQDRKGNMEQDRDTPASTPYRIQAEIPPLRSWAVRSSVFARVRSLVLGLLVISIPLALVVPLQTSGRTGPLLWVGPIIGVLCIIMFLTARLGHGAGRVAGGRGQIDLYDDRLVVPALHGHGHHGKLVLPLAGVDVKLTHHQVSFNFVVTSEDTWVELRAGAVERVLSSRLFRSASEFEGFVEAVEKARRTAWSVDGANSLLPTPGSLA
jgi:hypothetical protein